MAISVRLVPHTAKKKTILGEIDQEFDQSYVFANDHHVGYVGKQAGAHINFTIQLPRSVKQEIAAAIGKLKGEVETPPVVEMPTDEQVREALKKLDEDNES